MRWRKEKILLLLIILFASIVRFSFLDRLPSGFIPEEVSNGWNAYSLLKTGNDEWGTRFPLIFRETGGFKLALNSYLIVPAMAVFGVNEFAVRFPVAFSGVLSVYLTYLLSKIIFRQEKYALAGAMLLAINPWFIATNRYGVDVNWGVPLFLLGLIFLLKAHESPRFLIVSSIFFALTYYTYFNYVVFTFLFILILFLIKRDIFWIRENRKFVIIFLLIQFIFLSPYIFQPNLTTRFSQATSVGKIGLLNQIHEHRQACLTRFPLLVCRLLYNKPIVQGLEIVRNYINHYSTSTLFLYGSQLGLSGMPDRWGFFYLFEFPLLIFGFTILIKNKKFSPVLILWLFLYGLPSSLAGEMHFWRMMTLLPLPQIISGIGLIEVVKKLKFRVVPFVLVFTIGFFVFRFVADYTSFMPFNQGRFSYFGFRDLYRYLSKIEDKYDYIVIAPSGLSFDQLYIYYVFYMQPNPKYFQQDKDIERIVGEQNWVKVKRIGKWHFEGDVRNVIFSLPDRTLFVADGTFNEKEPLPGNVMFAKMIHNVNYENGDPAFKIFELYKNPDYKEIKI